MSVEDVVLLHRRQIFLWKHSQSPCSSQHNIYLLWFYDSLDQDGDVLVQVAAIELDQIDQDMEKVRGETNVHPQEDKSGCGRERGREN